MMEVVGVDGPCLVQRGGGQRVVGDTVDRAQQAAGCLEQRLDGGFLEHGQFAAGQAQSVLEVGIDLVAGQPGEVGAWQASRDRIHANVNWQFTTDDARVKLKRLYPTLDD